jgi:hypothetical protein
MLKLKYSSKYSIFLQKFCSTKFYLFSENFNISMSNWSNVEAAKVLWYTLIHWTWKYSIGANLKQIEMVDDGIWEVLNIHVKELELEFHTL